MSKSRYRCNWHLSHNGKVYPPDETVELDADEKAALGASGVVSEMDAEGVKVTAAAAALAAEHGLELEAIEGSGADGSITKNDVASAIKAAGDTPPA